jgi:hypothetical protein
MISAITDGNLAASSCVDCGDMRFPPRAACVRCDGTTNPVPLTEATVSSTVELGDRCVIRAATDHGLTVVVPGSSPADRYPPGSRVTFTVSDARVVAAPT